MKLWYQSMSRQTEWGGYPPVLREILDRVKDPDTDIHVAGITEIGGVGDQFRYLEYLETGEVLKNVGRAVREGYDAFLIGNIADPGLRWGSVQKLVGSRGDCDSCIWTADGFEPLTEAGTKCPVVNCATDLQHQIGTSPGPTHLLRLVHSAIDQEIRRTLRHRSPDAHAGAVSSGVVDKPGALAAEI
ncbi:MAG TPA: hypothetical protein VME47_11845, partial [Acetobacteraceae bacterium]|nr:hypothetical protein [Acetobacteraceae bacterium]